MNELRARIDDVLDIARDLGLDFYDIHFEVVPFDVMTELAAYGLPIRGQHWSYGKVYDRQRIHGRMGLSKIFEIVVNSNPAYAFLLDTNQDFENMMIAAHVAAHVDFFKHNALFSVTHRGMVNEAAAHAARLDSYKERYGLDRVEHLMDIAFALDRHIDFHKGLYRKPYPPRQVVEVERTEQPYDDLHEKAGYSIEKRVVGDRFPPYQEADLLWFLIQYAPLETWEQDVLSMVREEAHYFYPQFMTKILNEGWASFWHAEIMLAYDQLTPQEMIDYAALNAAVVAPGPNLSLNPYYLGYQILKDVEQRFGRERLFRIRTEDDDISFLLNYLTEELCEKLQLFRYGRRCKGHTTHRPDCPRCQEVVIVSRDVDEVREAIVQERYNYGVPYIVVDEVVSGTLRLEHVDRRERTLDLHFAQKTLQYIHELWKAPVVLVTSLPNHRGEIELSYDAQGFRKNQTHDN